MAQEAANDPYQAIKPSTEDMAQQLVLKEGLIKIKSLTQWKHELSDCSRAATGRNAASGLLNLKKFYYVIVRKDMKDASKDQIRFVENAIAEKAEDKYNEDKADADKKLAGHSSIVTAKDYAKHQSKKGAYNVIMAGSFTINNKENLNGKKTNCMTDYDNDSGHFKGHKDDLDAVANHWGFQGEATKVDHEGNVVNEEELIEDEELPPPMQGFNFANIEYFNNNNYDDNQYETRSGYLSGSNYEYSNIHNYGYNYYTRSEIFLLLPLVLLLGCCICVIAYLLGLVCGCIGTNIILKSHQHRKNSHIKHGDDMDRDHPI